MTITSTRSTTGTCFLACHHYLNCTYRIEKCTYPNAINREIQMAERQSNCLDSEWRFPRTTVTTDPVCGTFVHYGIWMIFAS